jgi:predicted HTH transcriptional regulator
MNSEEIQRLILQGEGPTLEFKVSIPRPETTARIIASFANTEGGKIRTRSQVLIEGIS